MEIELAGILTTDTNDNLNLDYNFNEDSNRLDKQDKKINMYRLEIEKIDIPEDYDYCIIEIKPDDYKKLISRMRQVGVEDELINKLAFNRAARGFIEYRWGLKKLRELNSRPIRSIQDVN